MPEIDAVDGVRDGRPDFQPPGIDAATGPASRVDLDVSELMEEISGV